MKAKFNDLEYEDIEFLVAGFVTKDQKEALKFNMIASPNIMFNEAMQLIQSLTQHFLKAMMEIHPEAKEDIYDAYNFMASSVLENLIPDKELRQDLDEAAIMETQKKMIEEEYAKMSDKEKAKALKDIDKLKADLLAGKKRGTKSKKSNS